MGDVYDFKTGRLCKRCAVCRFWKDLEAFSPNPLGKYKRSNMCDACKDKAYKTQRVTNREDLGGYRGMKIRLVKMRSGKYYIQEWVGHSFEWVPCKRIQYSDSPFSLLKNAKSAFKEIITRYEYDVADKEVTEVLDIYG